MALPYICEIMNAQLFSRMKLNNERLVLNYKNNQKMAKPACRQGKQIMPFFTTG